MTVTYLAAAVTDFHLVLGEGNCWSFTLNCLNTLGRCLNAKCRHDGATLFGAFSTLHCLGRCVGIFFIQFQPRFIHILIQTVLRLYRIFRLYCVFIASLLRLPFFPIHSSQSPLFTTESSINALQVTP